MKGVCDGRRVSGVCVGVGGDEGRVWGVCGCVCMCGCVVCGCVGVCVRCEKVCGCVGHV